MRLRYDDPTPLRFVLERTEDETGISGTGKVASGCCFPDGSAVVHWNTDIFTTTSSSRWRTSRHSTATAARPESCGSISQHLDRSRHRWRDPKKVCGAK